MAKAAGRRLKVFQAQFGFYDTVVAAPSQAAALRAWGAHQNLFADGQAHATEDPRAVEAALAHPETPLRRALGSTDPFALETAALPSVSHAPPQNEPKKAPAKPGLRARPAAALKPPADRSALDAAEAALLKLKEDRATEEANFRRQQDDLDAGREAARAAYVKSHRSATQGVAQAREAYRKAGGAS